MIRGICYDTSGRTLVNTTATGQSTTTVWDSGGQDLPVSSQDGTGRVTTTVYDWALRATDSYGPATSSAPGVAGSCFQSSGYPVASPPPTCGTIPHTHTGFDTDKLGNRINALQTTSWNNIYQAGAPATRSTSLPSAAAWTSGASSQYTGEIALAPGTYSFSASLGGNVANLADDGIRMFIDGQPVFDRWTSLDQAILSDSPDAYWRLGDASGSGTAASGLASGGAAGTASNVTFGVDAGPGTVDPTKAGKFNGTSSKVTLPNANVPSGTGALSVDAWVKPAAIGAYQMIVTKDTSNGATNNPYELRLDPSGHVQFLQSNGTVYTATSTSTLTAGTWYEVTATKTGSGLVQLYINGTADGANVAFPGTMSTNTLDALIGVRNDNGLWFNGDIADVSISSQTLTADRVAARYAAGVATLSGTSTVIFAAPPTLPVGTLPVAPVSTPHTVRIDYRNRLRRRRRSP